MNVTVLARRFHVDFKAAGAKLLALMVSSTASISRHHLIFHFNDACFTPGAGKHHLSGLRLVKLIGLSAVRRTQQVLSRPINPEIIPAAHMMSLTI